ncbi:espin protein forked isoform X2 [Choristoneura fumiferana]|uniref:espin protein forked isoform X2 n=2 Tax=Choristoneura fumiferana TaxID=7141 RepID=UPI003D158BBE
MTLNNNPPYNRVTSKLFGKKNKKNKRYVKLKAGTYSGRERANTAMDNDVTPVYLAAQEGHLAVLKYLVLEAGGRLDARARDGMLPIHAAAQTGCLDCVKWMIVERGVDPNARDGDGATPLHFAASRGHLSTVRWLLRHGARLHLDRHGKSPINDAAENHHLDCLNVLVAAGAAGADSKQLANYKAVHSCACTPGDARCALPNCVNANGTRSPFYLHAPERERRGSVQERRGSLPSTPIGSISSDRSGPADGLYVNPMQRTSTTVTHHSSEEESSACSASDADASNASGWYLHNATPTSNAPAALYQRVRDLFHTRSPGPRVPAEGQEAPVITVKAEVHGSEATTVPEQSDSDSGAEATRRDHHYEDIYMPKQDHQRRRSSSRDSGSHSRPGSAALVVDYTPKDSTDNISKAYEEVSPAPEAHVKSTIATKLAALTHKAQNFASRLSSAAGSRRASVTEETTVVQASASSGVSSGGSSGDEAPPPPPPPPRPRPPPQVLEEPALRPSELRGRLATRRGSAASADDERPRGLNLVNKQAALPFVPPAFPHNAPDRLIKPSEYLKTITAPCKRDDAAAEARPPPPPPVLSDNVPPPPPPAPPSVTASQPLAVISSAELSAVRLRAPAAKTLSAPPPARSVSLQCLPSADYKSAKIDLIEELKMSKDITGIKKLKVERARRESLQDKETFTEFTKRFTAENFVDQGCPQVPERDAAGNVIPAWKRQMLARRAAEKARRDLERELAGEAERRRAAAVPAWKRQLLARREEAENRLRQTLYTPKVEEPNGITNGEWRAYPSGTQRAVSIDNISLCYDTPAQPMRAPSEAKLTTEHCNGHTNGKHEEDEVDAKIIPWRAQLRKTNSKLNLLE